MSMEISNNYSNVEQANVEKEIQAKALRSDVMKSKKIVISYHFVKNRFFGGIIQ